MNLGPKILGVDLTFFVGVEASPFNKSALGVLSLENLPTLEGFNVKLEVILNLAFSFDNNIYFFIRN